MAGTTVAPDQSTSPPTTIPVEPARRVLVLGDSGMVDAAPAVVAMFQATGAVALDGSRGGLGLTRLGFEAETSPFAELWAGMVAAEEPDLIVVMLGVWDGGWVEANGPSAYAPVVEEAVRILTSQGARVLWLSTPPEPTIDDRPVDHVFAQVAANHPGQVFYADIDAAVRTPDGTVAPAYRSSDGTTVQLRKADGWHFCPDGAAAVATEIERLVVELGLTVSAGTSWVDGGWRAARVYDGYPECRN
ncbi:MAG TPA: hypothetical protein VIY72_13755 [Acidimicrobiales bacterium]